MKLICVCSWIYFEVKKYTFWLHTNIFMVKIFYFSTHKYTLTHNKYFYTKIFYTTNIFVCAEIKYFNLNIQLHTQIFLTMKLVCWSKKIYILFQHYTLMSFTMRLICVCSWRKAVLSPVMSNSFIWGVACDLEI